MAVYDRLARYYDTAFAPLERIGLRSYRQETLSLLPDGGAILELGAGTGANFEFYPTTRLTVSTEFSAKMLDKAALRRRQNQLVAADAQALPFADDSFDAAFATLVFCSIPNPELAFQEVRRVVRTGGRLVLLEHVRPDGALASLFDLISRATVWAFEDHFNRRTAELASRSGLKVLEVRKKMWGIVNLIVCEV